MMVRTQKPGAGFRRFDVAAAHADKLAGAFTGLPEGRGTGHVLAAFKRAACYLEIPPSIVQLIDVLFSWTKREDWAPGRSPIVWPRNEKLARKLGLQVRQVQNLLDRAVALKLISHRDSPNGHRGGVRTEDGHIKWAYGILLSPIGARYDDFIKIAAQGAAEEEFIDQCKRRLASTRRRIATLAQTATDNGLEGTKADEEYELVLMATRQMRKMRDTRMFIDCVERLEERAIVLEQVIAAHLLSAEPQSLSAVHDNNACKGVAAYTHSTTTNQIPTAKAVSSSGLARESSRRARSLTEVEEDLDSHGIDPEFIEAIVPDLCQDLGSGNLKWGAVVALAEGLATQNSIHPQAWREACRLMGERGAAASVLATIHKYRAGEVRRPGAYLRGMSARAAKGELHLGRTFHGLKDLHRAPKMKSFHIGSDGPQSVGEIARRAMAQASLVLSGRSL